MNKATILERLSAHRSLGSAPPNELAWFAEHGALRRLEPGSVLTSPTKPVDGLYVVLEGHLAIHVDQGTGKRKVMEWLGGDVTGLLPYSRLRSPPGDVVAEEPTELLAIHRDLLPEMIRECHELTSRLVHLMVDRARHFTSSFLHDEKLVSLGKLAAGLAHELNNPTSAIARSASTLSDSLVASHAAARALGALGLTPEQTAVLERVRDACLVGGSRSVLSPLELEDRENAISAWLADHGAEPGSAESLAETAMSFDMLDQLSSVLDGPALDTALRWMAAGCLTHRLTLEIQHASSRIHALVGAVKGFTQMDRATESEPVQLEAGLSDTLMVIAAKARGKSVGVSMDVGADLPPVNAYGGELNQVWLNLIDNALDAVGEGGRVALTATKEGDKVVVRVIDDGPGVPAEIRDRIFDPFFTTKATGQGTGLGLDIVRRLVQRHDGQIELDSTPGRNEFRVILPAATPRPADVR